MRLEEHNLIYFCWFLPGAGIRAETATRTGCFSEEDNSAAEDRASHYWTRLPQQQAAAHERYPASGSLFKYKQAFVLVCIEFLKSKTFITNLEL